MSGAGQPVRIGPVAAEIIGFDGEVDVAAVFERCFYVTAPRGFLCVGVEALGDGPLNVLLDFQGSVPDWAAFGVTREAKGTIRHGRLLIGDWFALALAGVARWHPEPWPMTSMDALRDALAALFPLAAPLCPAEGLSRLVIGDARRADRTAQAAAGLVREFSIALTTSFASRTPSPDLQRAAILLLGLGPGLTPSGDDLIGGVLVALSALGHVALREGLWRALEPELEHLTVDISAAHLAAAADGLASAAVHDALRAIMTADTDALPEHLAALAEIGHSSGFDTLAGLVLACQAALSVGAAGGGRG